MTAVSTILGYGLSARRMRGSRIEVGQCLGLTFSINIVFSVLRKEGGMNKHHQTLVLFGVVGGVAVLLLALAHYTLVPVWAGVVGGVILAGLARFVPAYMLGRKNR